MSNPLGMAVEAVVPTRLGRSFRWLLSAYTVMNLGDGIVVAAGPLLVASQTHEPFLVSLAVFFEYLPTLVFASIAGVIADRIDRQRLAVVMNLARAAVLAIMTAAIVTDDIGIVVILGALLLLGTCETFADLGSSSLMPTLVPREGLGLANARVQGSGLLTNQLVGPPIGAFLFVLGMAIPFAVDAVCLLAGAVLLSRIATSGRVARDDLDPTEPHTLRAIREDLVEGARWLRHHAAMRTLVLTIVAFNVTFGAAWGVLVLYSTQRLGMDSVGYGLLATANAVGGIIGTLLYGRLERRFSLGDIMRVGLLIETGTHLILALTRSPTVALVVLVIFGAHAFIWGTTSTTVRQRAVPDELMGRIIGIYRVAIVAGMVIGTPIGGVLASWLGITAPFWFGFIGSAILVTIMWREFSHIAHDAAAEATA